MKKNISPTIPKHESTISIFSIVENTDFNDGSDKKIFLIKANISKYSTIRKSALISNCGKRAFDNLKICKLPLFKTVFTSKHKSIADLSIKKNKQK